MADVLSPQARALIERPVLASLATIFPDGSPQITPLWIDLDGDDVLFNTSEHRVKARNLRRDPQVAVSVIDPDDFYNVVAFRGTVIEMSHEGAIEHLNALSQKYLGKDFAGNLEGQERVIVRVRTDHISMQS
jgi:PPOX class probable F420-dependent enzyme